MLTRIYSAALVGVDAVEVEIEVNDGGGDGKIVLVGLPDAAVRESIDRVTTAISNSSLNRPRGRVTINLAPADLKKEGPGFDLPIALCMAALRDGIDPKLPQEWCCVGELALDGKVRRVRGVLATALEAKRRGHTKLMVPADVAAEASVVGGIDIYAVHNLKEAYDLVKGQDLLQPEPCRAADFFAKHAAYDIDFRDVKGQLHVKRAIEVAVAGAHNLLMIGPPGTGKSMIAKRVPTIMPPMSEDEAIDTTKIHSAAGLLDRENAFIATRPFRSPHHTISDVGLLGGGANPTPGEVSLGHNGVLFLDELPEFRRSTLEVMRQPMEDGKVTIARAAATVTFPCRFMLVSAMNPCPCGFNGDPKRECRCTPLQVANYRQRISGPLLDRIDLHVEVPLVDYKDLSTNREGESSETIRTRVEAARSLQRERFKDADGISANSAMTPALMKKHCTIDAEGSAYLEQAMGEMNFSARAHDRILKVARTLADLEESDKILGSHILEAIQYRSLDRNLWV